MGTRPVVILSPFLSGNAVGRAMVLADLLQGHRQVHLAGPRSELWMPLLARRDIDVVLLSANPFSAARELATRFPDATLIASKPQLASFGVGLMAKRQPIVLDIDDPEVQLAMTDARTFASALFKFRGPLATTAMVALRSRAATITVSNSILQRRFGGTVIPHARDERIFDPELRDRTSARTALGVDSAEKLVAFVGTVRSHKGVDLLRRAVALAGPQVRLAVVGGATRSKSDHEIQVGQVDYLTALRWVAAADVIAVPQTTSRVASAQSPAKLGDALAMGRAIVTTDIGPIREIVGDAALVVAPDSAEALADGLRTILRNESIRRGLETAARARFDSTLSFSVVRPSLLDVLGMVEGS